MRLADDQIVRELRAVGYEEAVVVGEVLAVEDRGRGYGWDDASLNSGVNVTRTDRSEFGCLRGC